MDHKKYHQIQKQIDDARQALQQWNDRRAEAMIELDSIFTEIEEYKAEVTAEQSSSAATIAELKTALEKSDREFHKHFEDYTNDMQELKLENEKLTRQLKEALNEVESEKQSQKKMEARFLKKIEEASAQAQIRVADEQYQLKNQVTNLIAEMQSLQNERKTLSSKADQYEKELRTIRSQMMSFLNVTKDSSVSGDVIAPIVVSAESLNAQARREAEHADAAALNGAGASSGASKKSSNKLHSPDIIVDNLGNAPTTVNDYLKKFGY